MPSLRPKHGCAQLLPTWSAAQTLRRCSVERRVAMHAGTGLAASLSPDTPSALALQVEEALVALEALASSELEWPQLEGCWRLTYTTAADVLPLVQPQLQLGPLRLPAQVGRVWQRFSSLAGGRVQNIIELRSFDSLPLLGGCTALAVVVAGYEQRTQRSIGLSFQSAGLQTAALSPGLQNLLASPLLPRGQAQLAMLQALRGASVSVPLPQQVAGRQRSGGSYSLTWLDSDMLVGRAQGSGGSFVFDREGEGEEFLQLLGEL